MSEQQIESIAERAMDRLDRRLMSGRLSGDDYANAVQDLDNWATAQYRKSKIFWR